MYWQLLFNFFCRNVQIYFTKNTVLEVMTEFGSDFKAKLLHEQLEDTEASRVIIEIINTAMYKLRTYPNNGEQYHQILMYTYFSDKKSSETDLLDKLQLSRSTYFRLRKKAISLFGVILWGYVLPEFMKQHETKMVLK